MRRTLLLFALLPALALGSTRIERETEALIDDVLDARVTERRLALVRVISTGPDASGVWVSEVELLRPEPQPAPSETGGDEPGPLGPMGVTLEHGPKPRRRTEGRLHLTRTSLRVPVEGFLPPGEHFALWLRPGPARFLRDLVLTDPRAPSPDPILLVPDTPVEDLGALTTRLQLRDDPQRRCAAWIRAIEQLDAPAPDEALAVQERCREPDAVRDLELVLARLRSQIATGHPQVLEDQLALGLVLTLSDRPEEALPPLVAVRKAIGPDRKLDLLLAGTLLDADRPVQAARLLRALAADGDPDARALCAAAVAAEPGAAEHCPEQESGEARGVRERRPRPEPIDEVAGVIVFEEEPVDSALRLVRLEARSEGGDRVGVRAHVETSHELLVELVINPTGGGWQSVALRRKGDGVHEASFRVERGRAFFFLRVMDPNTRDIFESWGSLEDAHEVYLLR